MVIFLNNGNAMPIRPPFGKNAEGPPTFSFHKKWGNLYEMGGIIDQIQGENKKKSVPIEFLDLGESSLARLRKWQLLDK